jgi:RimJ/RimL family protein N-acetyltransferase
MTDVRLRALRPSDLDPLTVLETPEGDPWNNFEFRPANLLHRRYAENGGIGDRDGTLAVEAEGDLVGTVGWHAVRHGPSAACTALNIGISLFADRRGRGYGPQAQRLLADYLFASRPIERVEASTEVTNLAEQRALQKAGFQREGVLRHAMFHDGGWHDVILYSRLRSDP